MEYLQGGKGDYFRKHQKFKKIYNPAQAWLLQLLQLILGPTTNVPSVTLDLSADLLGGWYSIFDQI